MKQLKRWLKTGKNRLRLGLLQAVRWWHINDQKYHWKWRAANGALAVFLLLSAALPIAQHLWQQQAYALSADTQKLVGQTDASLSKQLTYDANKQQYVFNQSAITTGGNSGLQAALQKASVGASGKSNTKSYALDVPEDFSKGVTYYDTNSQLSFSLVPQFSALPAKTVDGHLVFPINGGNQAIYTLKNNGLKEDIVVPKTTQDSMTFNYQLNLPKTLQVKTIPGSGGAVGIYSADPSLFGNITYSSDKDRAAVQTARENGDKTYLVFGLPAPVVKDTTGNEVGSARFQLNGNNLSVIAEGLSNAKGAVTIDPSVVVTSTSDFQTSGNNEGNIDFSTSGQINRGGLTGGSVSGGWSSTTSFTTARYEFGTVAYNGYLYVLGGYDGSGNRNDVQYAPINSGGTIGTWTTTSSFTTARSDFDAAVYDGYIYIAGGYNGDYSDVQYAQINADGSLGTWQTTSSFTNGRDALRVVAYSGYLYIVGGCSSSDTVCYTAVQYAPLNANGTVGTWQTTSSFTNGRSGARTIVYNGYIYLMGGHNGSTYYNDVQYAQINADGSLGTWQTTSSFTNARYQPGAVVYNGYIYLMGGRNGSSTYYNDVQYAPIYANGSVGTWRTTSSFTNIRYGLGAVSYNGYTYILGGYNGSSTYYNDVQYAKIDPAGQPGSFSTSSAFTTTRRGAQTIAYQGSLFVIGGDAGSTPVATVRVASLNSDGTLGSWVNAGSFTTARTFMAAALYDGYLYVLGGCTSAFASCSTATNNITTVTRCTYSWSGQTIGSCAAQTGFTTARYGFQATIYKNYIYIMGGLNGSTYQNDVQYHALNTSTGAISGAWTTATSTYNVPTARAYFGLAQGNNGTLYIAGGLSGSGNLSDVQYATLNTSGGGFSTAWASTTSFTNARYGFGIAISQGYIYLAGGYDGSTYYSDTQYAPINANGTIGTWVSGPSMANGLMGVTLTALNGNLYTAGGYNGTTYYATVQLAPINNGGNGLVSNAGSATTTLPNNCDTTMVGYKAYLYIVCGDDGNGTSTTIYYASVSGGGVGTWTTTSSLQTGRESPFVAALNGYLYVLSGNSSSGYITTGEYAPINSNGTLGSWSYTTANFTTTAGSVEARDDGKTAIYNGYIYMLAGCGNSTCYEVDYAKPASNGNITSMSATTNLTQGRNLNGSALSATAYNGYLYVDGSLSGSQWEVQYAAINSSNGTVGSWVNASQPEKLDNQFEAMIAYNGFMYDLNSQSAAPIASDGSLGRWERFSSPGGLGGNNLYVYNGWIYGSVNYVTIYYGSLNSIARTAQYSKLMDLGLPTNVSNITYNGTVGSTALSSQSPISYRAAGSNGVFGSTVTNASAIVSGATGCLGSNQNYTRYLLTTVTLDDSGATAVFPDSSGTASNVTDFTVNYTPVHRLRMFGCAVARHSSLAA